MLIFRTLRKERKIAKSILKVASLRFIDPLNFLLTGLAQLPVMSSLEERKKGFLPHRFNVPGHQDYVGPYPDKKYYGVNELRGGVSDAVCELVGPITGFEKFLQRC